MSIEENKAIIHSYFDMINKHDLTIVDQIISDDYVLHGPGGQDIKGQEVLKQAFIAAIAGFPDLHYQIDDMVAEGDKVAVRYTRTGTHKGDYRGIAPTGKWTKAIGALFYRLVDGKIVERLGYSDQLTLFQQMGVSPPGQ